MSKAQLKKATITVLDGADKGKVITVLFNPTEYSFERTNSYKSVAVPGLSSPLLQFVSGESDRLSMDLFLDDYTDPNGPTSCSVAKYVILRTESARTPKTIRNNPPKE